MKPDILKRLFLFFALIPLLSFAQDSLKQNRFVFNGYIKDMQSLIFEDIKGDWTGAILVHNRLNFKWLVSSSLTASIELRNRLFAGNILTAYPGYNQTFETDDGMADLSKNLIDQKFWLLNTAIDRLWLQYAADKFQITVGRQRINWGQTFVWNPNDLFNSYSYFDFDYEEKPGSDAIRLQYYPGPASVMEFVLKSNSRKEVSFAGLYRFNQWNYDFQVIGGIADQRDLVVGAGWSGQLFKGGFRGEATYFHPKKELTDTNGVFLASVGYDFTFKNALFLQSEVLYNGNNQSSAEFSFNQMSGNDFSAKNLFLPGFSMFFSLSYPVTPLLSSSLAVIGNPGGNLVICVPTMNISLSENLELSLTAQLLRYTVKNDLRQDLNFIYVRLKKSF